MVSCMTKMRTTVVIDKEMWDEAKSLGISLADVTRSALSSALETKRKESQLDAAPLPTR